MIFNGDVLSSHSLKDQIDFHQNQSADVTLYLTEVLDARAFGVVEMSGDFITTFNEKMDSPPTNIINAGCYIFNRAVIDEIPAGRVVSVERETFPGLLSRNARVAGFIDNSYWLDIGNPGALLKATRDLIEASGHQMAQGRGSTIDPTAVVDEGSYVGAQANVGAGSQLHQCIIGEGATIGEKVQLTRTFVASGTRIEPNTVAIDEFFGFSPE